MNPCVIWFTGLSGSGKSTLAEAFVADLKFRGIKTEYLDGDAIRELFPNTGFTQDERNKHVRWVGFLAGRLERNGVVVVASFVSPFRESREFARSQARRFFEIYVSTPLEECEKRDVKGLYKKARQGEIENFTGVSAPYEEPISPELNLNTTGLSMKDCLDRVKIICGAKED